MKRLLILILLFACSDMPTSPEPQTEGYWELEFNSAEDDRLFNFFYNEQTGLLTDLITRKVERNISDKTIQVQKTRMLIVFQKPDGVYTELKRVKGEVRNLGNWKTITEVGPDETYIHYAHIDSVQGDPNLFLYYWNRWVDISGPDTLMYKPPKNGVRIRSANQTQITKEEFEDKMTREDENL
jgi:hypothetical protein